MFTGFQFLVFVQLAVVAAALLQIALNLAHQGTVNLQQTHHAGGDQIADAGND